MKKAYYYFLCDDEVGEVWAFFKVIKNQLHLIHWMAANDANYRPEYMNSLFRYFNVSMLQLPEIHFKAADALLKAEV